MKASRNHLLKQHPLYPLKEDNKFFYSGQLVLITFDADVPYSLIEISENASSIFELSDKIIISDEFSLHTIIHPDDQSKYLLLLNESLSGKIIDFDLILRLKKGNGKFVYFYHFVNLIRDENHHPLFFAGYFIEMHEDCSLKETLELERAKFQDCLKHFQSITDNITDVVFTCDLELNTMYISPSIERLTGDTPHEHIKKLPHEKHTPESLLKMRSLIQEEFENEKNPDIPKNRSRVVETQYFKSDGSIIDISSNISFTRDDAGRPTGFQGVIRDISELRKSELQMHEHKLRANTQRQALTKLVINPIVNGGILPQSLEFIAQLVAETLSVEIVSIWNINEDESEMQCVTMYNSKENAFLSKDKLYIDSLPKYFHALRTEGRIYANDVYQDPRTSELIENYLQPYGITSMLDAGVRIDGKLSGIICCEHVGKKRIWHADEKSFISTVSSVISQIYLNNKRRIAEEALHRSEENLRITLNSIGDAVIATDINGIITNINYIACQLTGWNCQEAIGKHMNDVFHIVQFETGKTIESPLEKVLRSGSIIELANNTTLISRYGYKYQISDSAAPILNENKEIVGVVLVFRDITREYLNAKALSDSEKKYRELYHTLRDASHAVDINGNITEYNHAFQKMLGYNSNEISNVKIKDITPEKWWDFEKRIIEEQVKTKGYSQPYEKEYIKKDGTIFPVELTTYLKKDEFNNHIGYWAFIRDITDRKQAEKISKLNFEGTRALLMLNQMTDSSLKEITNFALEKAVELTESKIGYLAFLNEDETILTMHAWSENAMKECAIIDKPIHYVVAETGLWGEAVRQRKAIITNDYNSESPWTKGTPDGHVAVLRHMNTPIFDDNKIVVVAGVGNKEEEYTEQDVEQLTLLMQGMWRMIERKRSEDELKIFKESLENSTDAIAMSTPQGIHYFQNTAFSDLFGSISEYPPDTLYVDQTTGKEVFETIMSGNVWSGEVQMYSRNKKILEILLRAYPVKDKNGNITALVGIHNDISDRILAEKELIEAKNKAEQSDKLKSVFLANVSHEIRTPMNAILGFLELLKEPGLKTELAHSYIDIVNQSGKRLLNTINDIIEISKIESGQSDVHITEVNTKDIMVFHYNMFRQLSRDKGLLLLLSDHLQGDKAVIQTDRHKLEGILTNLINNAIKFTHEGSIEIGNRLEEDYLLFYVKDTGMGIPEDRIEAVFDRFVQADTTTSRNHEGSGLGLSIISAYLEMLKGKIWVESEIGKGSTFYFTIPYVTAYNDHSKYLSVSQGKKEKILKDTILIAEDDDLSFKLIETILQKQGLKTIRVTNGEEAVGAVYDTSSIALAIIDISLKGMDGLEATRQIRLFNKKIPVFVMSANALNDENKQAKDAGCNEFISKPVDIKEFIVLLKKYIEQSED